MPILNEKDAILVRDTFDLLSDEEKPLASEWMQKYEAQQNDLGEPLFPSQVQAMNQNREAVRKMFDGLDKLQVEISPWSEDANRDRAIHANMALLSDRYGKKPQEIADRYDFYLNDYAAQKFGMPQGVDDLSFYAAAAKELQREKQKEDTEAEGVKAALRGDDVIPALQAWQAKNLDRLPDSTEYTRGFLQARERSGEHLEFADSLLKQIESNTGLTKGEGAQRPAPASRETAAQFEESLATLAEMKPKDRKQVYAIIGAKAEMAGYDQKGFWAQMLSELGKGTARMGSTVTTQMGVSGDVLANLPAMLSNTMTEGEFDVTEASIARRQGIGEMYDEVARIVAGEVDPVRPVISWMNDTVETGLIKGPGAVAPFMMASAALGPFGAGALFTADFAEQNRRELRASGMDNAQAVAVGAAAAPLQAVVESLSNALQLGRFPAVQRVLSNFTKPIGGGSGLAVRYLQNAGLSLATEFTEEQLQDNFIVPATQELFGALESDMPQVDWSMYRNRAIESTPELLSILAPMALVFGGTMTSAQANLSSAAISSQDMLEAAGYSAAQANEVRIQPTEEAKISKAREFWGARAGTPQTIETAAKTVGERMRMLQGDAIAAQKDLESRGILPRMLRASESAWKLTFNDGSTADFNSHREADAARWQWATDQLGKVHLATRSALAQLESGAAVGREFAVEFKPDVMTAQMAVDEGRVDPAQIQRRVQQGAAVGESAAEPVNETETFDNTVATDKATSDYLASLQILGSSSNEFKDGVLRTTIRLYEGANVLTLVEEKLEGDAKQIIASKPGREWMLSKLREYERVSGDTLFRKVADNAELQNDDLIEAWSSLGQSYLVGKSKKGAAIGKGGARRIFADVLKTGLAGAMNSETQFFNAVWRRAAKLSKLKREGKLGEDLTEELERQLGIDSQAKQETEAAIEAEAIANEALNVGGASYSEENGKPVETMSQGNESEPEPGELAPDSPTEDLPLEGDDIPWSDETFSIAPRSLPEVFKPFTKSIRDEILKETDTIAAIHIDRMKVGEFFGVPLQGGMFYPSIVENLKAGIVWAFNADNIARGVARRAAQNGGYVKLVLMQEGNVIGNKTFGTIWFKLLNESISNKRITKTAALAELNRVRSLFAEHPESEKATGHTKKWKTIEEAAETIIGMPQKKRGATYFQKSKDKKTGVIKYQSLLAQKMSKAGFPDAIDIVSNIEDASFKDVPTGAVVGIVQFDPLAENDKVMTAEEAGVPEHLSYKFVLKGRPVARMMKHTIIDQTFPEVAGKMLSQQHTNYPIESALTFSIRSVSPAQNAEYMTAVEAGDMETAQRMVDEAAKKARLKKVWRKGSVTKKGEGGFHFGTKEQADSIEDERQKSNAYFIKASNPVRLIDYSDWSDSGLETQGYDLDENAPIVYLNRHEGLGDKGAVDLDKNPLLPQDQDSLSDEEFLDANPSAQDSFIIRSSSQIKSADPVTYDDAGNVIPLSQRFNPADNRITYSIRSGDFASRMAAAFSPFQRNPELRLAIAQVAKARAQKLGAEWIEKAAVIRGASDIGKEARMREALAYEARMNDYMDGLTPNARQTLEFEPLALEDDPLVSAMLDFGKLMSFTNAKKAGKVDAKAGDYDGVPWLPPSFYSKGAGIMPDQMAQAMNDAGLLPDAYADTLWNELGKRIASTKKDKTAHREAVAAYKAAQKYAKDASRAEADQWAEGAKKKAGSPKAQRENLKAALRVLDGILAAAPPEVRAKVGGYVKLAGLATDEAMLKEIERRIEKLNVELEKWLKKEGIEQIEKLFKKARPDSEAGKKDKGKNADMHALFAAAERAAKMDEVAVAGELARLDSLIGGDTLTPEQEALAITERGIVELVGDLKNADAGRVFSALDTLRDIYEGGWIKWKLAQIEKREERAGMRAAFIADTGKSGVKPERDAAEREAETLLGKIKGGFLSLSSFHEVLSYAFGSTSARVKSLVDAEREASGQYEDVNQALADEVQDLFTTLAGGKVLDGEKLRFDMAQRTIQTAKGELSQLGAIQALLMWRQEDGRRHMEGQLGEDGKPISSWSYNQAWIDEITAQLTPEARSVMAWIMQKYGAEHAVLNPLYRQRYGVNMPAHDNYAPITVQPVQAKAGEVIDPVSGASMSSGSILTPGSLRTRSRNAIAEPEFRDALQTLLMHTRQLEYWKAYYDLALESSAILGNREVLNAVKAKGGEQAATALRKWTDAIAQGGFRDASASLEMNKMLQRMTGRAASVGLLGRFSTLLVQSTQLAAASVKMPLGSYLVGISKLLTGNLGYRDAINSPFIQRRYKSAPPIVRQAMEGLAAASRPNQIKRATRALGQLLSGTDALFTAGTYALLLDYHRGTGRALGLTGADLEEHAHTEAQRDTEQVAQPTRMAARSLAEVTSTNPLAKVSWAYASEARQKIALMAWAATKAKSEPAQFAKTAFLVFGVGGLLTQVLKGLWREAKGDDDEKKWSAERLTLAALTGPLHGVPLASELMGDQGMLSGVAWAWPALKDIASGEGDMRDVDTLLSTLGLFNDTAAAAASLSHAGLDAAKVIQNLADKK